MSPLTLPDERFPPERPPGDDYWAEVAKQYSTTMERAATAFRANLGINLVIVGIGIALIAVSIASSIVRGADLASVSFAGLGIVAFVSTFFLSPQKEIQKSLGNLVQIQMVYRTFLLQFEAVSDAGRELQKAGKLTLEDARRLGDDLSTITADAMAKIQSLAGEKV